MNPNRPICQRCAEKVKARGYLVNHLPPYLFARRNKVKCYLCGEMRFHYMYLNMEFKNHPRKVRVVR